MKREARAGGLVWRLARCDLRSFEELFAQPAHPILRMLSAVLPMIVLQRHIGDQTHLSWVQLQLSPVFW